MTIEPVGDRRFDVSVPVLVAGGGAAGLTAALALADEGVDCFVLERDHACLGSSSMSLGALCAAGTRAQAAHGVVDGPDAFLADIMAKTCGSADPVLSGAIAAEAGPAVDWLADRHGIEFALDAGWRPAFGHHAQRLHATAGRSGRDMMARFVAAAEAAQVGILTDAHVLALFVTADRRVRGVRLARPDGSTEEIGCEALVLATSGFGANQAMVAAYIPEIADAQYFGWDGNQGDGIGWGLALGGAAADMNAYQGLGLLAAAYGLDINPKLLIEGGIQVNALGHRFSNEVDDVSGQGARVVAQPGGVSWVIYDERVRDTCASIPQLAELRALGAERTGSDLPALAQITDLPLDALAATLDEVARATKRDPPDSFGRLFDRPPLAPPFYAIRASGALFHTQGGMVVDATARVLQEGGARFPNLFAVGGVARSISGSGASGYLPGAGLCMAITLGRIAGREAARLLRSGRTD